MGPPVELINGWILPVVLAPAVGSSLGAWLADLFAPRSFAFAAGAAAIVILLQAGVITKLVLQPTPSDVNGQGYTPASAGVAADVGAFVLVRFAPQASIADITRFLDAHDAVIVDGPRPGGPAGMYRVRVADMPLAKDQLDQVAKDFQASSDNLVNMAVPTE